MSVNCRCEGTACKLFGRCRYKGWIRCNTCLKTSQDTNTEGLCHSCDMISKYGTNCTNCGVKHRSMLNETLCDKCWVRKNCGRCLRCGVNDRIHPSGDGMCARCAVAKKIISHCALCGKLDKVCEPTLWCKSCIECHSAPQKCIMCKHILTQNDLYYMYRKLTCQNCSHGGDEDNGVNRWIKNNKRYCWHINRDSDFEKWL